MPCRARLLGLGAARYDLPIRTSQVHLAYSNQTAECFGSITGLKVTYEHPLTDNSLTFGAVHWNDPFQIYVELHYKLHHY
ncbi:MAG TPA: hypothetical protein VND80_08040 [Steroidobacteraceae bacterium]|nr:hypothetical protein [Steroidobacteraceae bacterium]